jgi:ribosomal-protein-alanine acetyltransferase
VTAAAVTLRTAGEADVPALVDLEAVLFGVDAWDDASVRDELGGPGRRVVVAELDGVVVGYAVTMVLGDVADLLRIGTAPAAQRRGVGRRLLDEAAAHARSVGADRLLLEVAAGNRAALGLYLDAGFAVVDTRRRYYRDGADAHVLRLPLVRGCGGSPRPS